MDVNDLLQAKGVDGVRAANDAAERFVPAPKPDPQPQGQKPAGKKPKFDWANKSRTAAQLATLQIPDVKWIIPRFLPEGVGILAGKPKGGKSWLALDWCIAIAAGELLFGGSVDITPEQGDVLYLAQEDNDRRLKSRIAKLCVRSPERLTLVSMNDNFPRANEGGIEAIEEWLIAHPEAKLVVVDTLVKFRPPANAKKGAYDQDYDAITPLLKLAHKYGVAILIIHHQRKTNSDDPFDSISGTLGLTGAADTLMILDRRANGMVLCLRGRDVEDEELAMQFEKETAKWKVLGSAQDVQRTATDSAIVDALYEAFKEAATDEDAALTIVQIKERAGLTQKRDTLKRHLARMADRGLIQKASAGKYRTI